MKWNNNALSIAYSRLVNAALPVPGYAAMPPLFRMKQQCRLYAARAACRIRPRGESNAALIAAVSPVNT